MMEVRIAELERRNTELEDQLHRGSDPLELRLQQLREESSQLQKKLRVSYHVDFILFCESVVHLLMLILVCSKLTELLSERYFLEVIELQMR